MLKYRCLALDHDDTAVKSSPVINYPSFIRTLEKLGRDYRPSYGEFMRYCCEVGFHSYCVDTLGFDEREMAVEFEMWKEYTATRAPSFHVGVAQALCEYKDAGGKLCVVSHSSGDNIRRDYALRCPDAMPDLVFGWDMGEGKRKPDAWPLQEAMRVFDLTARDLLVVDDLMTGLEMARSCGVDFACAGWSHADTPDIARLMRERAEVYLETPRDMLDLLLGR